MCENRNYLQEALLAEHVSSQEPFIPFLHYTCRQPVDQVFIFSETPKAFHFENGTFVSAHQLALIPDECSVGA